MRLNHRETCAWDAWAVSSGAPHVLVVDDDPIVRDVLLRYLARDGFTAEAAGTGSRRVEAFDARRPDLVVLDLMLPRIDGLEVFRRMRAADPASAVMMLTARGRETERIVGLDSGADDYVAKPFSPREIVARVKAILRRLAETGASPADAERAQPLASATRDRPRGARGDLGSARPSGGLPEGVRPPLLPRRPPANRLQPQPSSSTASGMSPTTATRRP